MNVYHHTSPFILTLFGATGDLAKIKVLPALFQLAEQNRLPTDYAIIGYARSMGERTVFQTDVEEAVKTHYDGVWGDHQDATLMQFLTHVHAFRGAYDTVEAYEIYADFRRKILPEYTQEILYFSVPPSAYSGIITAVGQALESEKEKIKLVIEKPFGGDECSARKLFHLIGQRFEERQTYLLDHYLGKKAVRSILPLRHHNRLLNLMLKGPEVANIQISALEAVGVQHRLGYFDAVGTLRDMIQSHLLQILALLTMSIPTQHTDESIAQEKAAILNALFFDGETTSVSLGQYDGYRAQSPKVAKSSIPTFAAVRLGLNRESWHGVPIFLRSGKALGNKQTYITIELKKFSYQGQDVPGNKVIIELSPNEKLHIKLLDESGTELRGQELSVDQSIACDGDHCLGEHALLILDVLRGAQREFVRFSEVLSGWKLVDQIVESSQNTLPELYAEGTEGPRSQHIMTEQSHTHWHAL